MTFYAEIEDLKIPNSLEWPDHFGAWVLIYRIKCPVDVVRN
jgi:hypothetical protein